MLVVPYPRRKRVESMLRGAKVKAEWIDAPTPEAIARNDRERLIEALLERSNWIRKTARSRARIMGERSARTPPGR